MLFMKAVAGAVSETRQHDLGLKPNAVEATAQAVPLSPLMRKTQGCWGRPLRISY